MMKTGDSRYSTHPDSPLYQTKTDTEMLLRLNKETGES